jgi:hypothetical protein
VWSSGYPKLSIVDDSERILAEEAEIFFVESKVLLTNVSVVAFYSHTRTHTPLSVTMISIGGKWHFNLVEVKYFSWLVILSNFTEVMIIFGIRRKRGTEYAVRICCCR